MDVTYLDFGAFLSFPFPSFSPSVSLIWLYSYAPSQRYSSPLFSSYLFLSLSSLLYHISLFFSFIIIYPFSFFIAETGRFNTLYHPSSL